MPDDKRTFEANAHLLKGPRLHARPVKGKRGPREFPLGVDPEEPLDREPLLVTQDLILRLIKGLKES